MNRLMEEFNFSDNKNGCLSYEDIFVFCVESRWLIEGKKLRDSVRLYQRNHLVQEFYHVQSGENLELSSLSDLRLFIFRLQGNEGSYSAEGLTKLEFNWAKLPDGEKSVLIFRPANFYLELFLTQEAEMGRLRYDVRCDFCSGLGWIEVREMQREGRPDNVLYYSSNEPRDITPRLFDSLLGRAYFLPLNQLGAAIQKTLVEEGGYFPLQF